MSAELDSCGMRPSSRHQDSRQSALWGSGSRNGDSRRNALWGSGSRGTRGLAVLSLAALGLVLPVAATAAPAAKAPQGKGYVAASLLRQAQQSPNEKIRVIVQSAHGADDAAAKVRGLGTVNRRLRSAGGVALELPARLVAKLAEVPALSVTPDARVGLSGLGSSFAWPGAHRLDGFWSRDAVQCAVNLFGIQLDPNCIPLPALVAPQAPAIAVFDSGVDATRPDLAGRVVAEASFVSVEPNSAGDGRGHGTLVAGVAAGAAPGYAGAAPNAPIVSIDVINDNGEGRISDIIAGIDWLLANKDALGVRVANMSLGAHVGSSLRNPLNDAIERMWFAGITVVASSGNYGVDGQATDVVAAPANDPFVITVGATDVAATTSLDDDYVAPWSVWGPTPDGFAKPDVSAAGRYMVGPVPPSASLALERPDNVVAPGYMRLSGTSFAAPVVAGAAAQLLAHHPDWTPDQVKGALMLTAKAMPLVQNRAGGVGALDAAAANALSSPPNPNAALYGYVVAGPDGQPVFDDYAWYKAASKDASWDEASWTDASWSNASWSNASWSNASWGDASWTNASWSNASWDEASWSNASWDEASWSNASWTNASWTNNAAGE